MWREVDNHTHTFCHADCQLIFHHMLPLSVKTKRDPNDPDGNPGENKKQKREVEVMTVEEIMLNKLIDIPDEVLMTIIKFTYPYYETKDQDFKKLNRLRKVNKKFNKVIDDMMLNMHSLPPMLLENITVDELEDESREKRPFKWRASQITSLRIPDYFNDKRLNYFTNLTSLDLSFNDIITNDGIKGLTKLTSLHLGMNKNITDNGIKYLTNLISLDLDYNKIITDYGIKGLTNLTSLDLDHNEFITDNGIKCLTKLIEFHLGDNKIIGNNGIKGLTNLTSLYLGWINENITDDGIKSLTNLTSLRLSHNNKITSKMITTLKNRGVFVRGLI
jgi:Leucine-rich repeat (LRR) protein